MYNVHWGWWRSPSVLATCVYPFSYHTLPSQWIPATAWQLPMCLPQPQLIPGCGLSPADTRLWVVTHWPPAASPFPALALAKLKLQPGRPWAQGHRTQDNKPQPALASTSPDSSWGPALPGQCKPMAFYWQWQKYWSSNPLFIVTEPQAITQEHSKDIANSTLPQGFWIKNEQHIFPACLLFPV